MAPECYAAHRRILPFDAIHEVRRSRAREGKKTAILGSLEGRGVTDQVYKNLLGSLQTVDERPCPRKMKIETDDVVEPRKRPVAPSNKKRKYGLPDQHDGRGKARISEDKKAQVPLKKVKEECEANKKTEVKKENDKIYQGRGSRKNSGSRSDRQVPLREKHVVCGQTKSMKAVQGDNGCSSKKAAAFGDCAVKKEPDHCVETHMPIKGINVKRAKCSSADNSHGKYMEGEGSSKVGPELVILDSDKVVKKEIVGGFVCSKKHHNSMADERCPSAIDSEFRRELVEVLKKPYDREEYKKSREAIRAGFYLDYHPGVQRKLTKYRYKREKCLIIVRGFLFWLQNLTREGAFEPWKDKQCLQLELPPN